MKMHDDEVETDVTLVRRLLAGQFPQWADVAIEPVKSAGTDNAIYRLGEAMAARLPRKPTAAEQVEKEQQWLPKLAPHLQLAIPVPIARGDPAAGYPFPWSVYPWLEGEEMTHERMVDTNRMVTKLAQFIADLHGIDPAGGPRPGSHNFYRGIPLAERDAPTRRSIQALDGIIDTGAAAAAWEATLDVPPLDGPPVWIHGDLTPDNLLVEQGRLSAVIDFGGLGVGDPACDLIIAWHYFSGDSRELFRAALRIDDATWARGRGWALSVALVALPYYLNTNPVIVRSSRRILDEVLGDHQRDA